MRAFCLLSFIFFCYPAAFAATEQEADVIFHDLLAAQAAKNYEKFVSNGTEQLKAALLQSQFDAASETLAKRFKRGYTIKFLGELNQRGCQVFLYKLVCKDGGDDILGTMALHGDKVAGILFN